MSQDRPSYRRYRARSGASGDADPVRELRDLRRGERDGGAEQHGRDQRPGRRPRMPGRLRPGRVLRWLVVASVAWVGVSLLVFLVSAQLHQASVDGDGADVLGGGGVPPGGTSTILLIGSDKRPQDTKEAGANRSGYGLADSIMLMRVGGSGGGRKLSIARDTQVPIDGYGVQKINAAYAIGGPALLVKTVEQYTGIGVNHIMQVGLSDFPELIDSMGGITYKGACVIGKVNGGYANGGVTVRIPAGKRKHLNGDQALALARTRKNLCNPREDDLSRARRQQRVVAAMKRRALSPIGFVRLPLIAWTAPAAMDSDMAGPRLLATMAGMALSRGGETHVLGTESGIVPDALREREVRRFLR